MPIDFQEMTFNDKVKQSIREIHVLIYNRQNAKDELNALWLHLSHYYIDEKKKDYSFDKAIIRVAEVYSQYLQQLVNYSYRTVTDAAGQDYVQKLVGRLLKSSVFHYKSFFYKDAPRVILWVDPVDDTTVLMNLCRYDDIEKIKIHLNVVAELYGGRNTLSFQRYISRVDKPNQYSALHFLSMRGYTNAVNWLIGVASEACLGKNTCGFQEFISFLDTTNSSVLHIAAYGGHNEVVCALLEAAQEAFGGVNTDGYRAFISQENEHRDSPLNAAVVGKDVKVVLALLETGKQAYQAVTMVVPFVTFLEHQNVSGFTPLNFAAAEACLDIAELCMAYGANPDIMNFSNRSARVNAPDAWTLFLLRIEPQTSASISPYRIFYHHQEGSKRGLETAHQTPTATGQEHHDKRVKHEGDRFDQYPQVTVTSNHFTSYRYG